MKTRIGPLLILLLITLVAAPAMACMYSPDPDPDPDPGSGYDATGLWSISLDPNQSAGIGKIVPPMSVSAIIEQYDNGGRFDLNTEELADLNGMSYSGSGSVEGSNYVFDEALAYSIDIGEWTGESIFDGKDATVSLTGFSLSDDNTLAGFFAIDSDALDLHGKISFTGTKEAVPVPAAVWLLGSGMAALFGIRKRVGA